MPGEHRRRHLRLEVDGRGNRVRAGVRRPDGGERLRVADDETARFDEAAVVAAGEGVDAHEARTTIAP